MKIQFLAIASLCAIAFCLPTLAQTHPIAAGYQMAISRKQIIENSDYGRTLFRAVEMVRQGSSPEQASQKTGIKLRVLYRLIQMGTPIPYVDAARPIPSPPSVLAQNVSPEIPIHHPVVALGEQKPLPSNKKKTLKIQKPKKIKLKREKRQSKERIAANVFLAVLSDSDIFSLPEFVVGWGLGEIDQNTFSKNKTKAKKPTFTSINTLQTLWLNVTEKPGLSRFSESGEAPRSNL